MNDRDNTPLLIIAILGILFIIASCAGLTHRHYYIRHHHRPVIIHH